MTPELIRRVTTTEGTRPKAAPIPEPGIYWIKQSWCDFYWIDETGTRLDNPQHNTIWSVYTWDLQHESEWFLASVEKNGDFSVMENDETFAWERAHLLITRVGPRIDPPEEAV